MPSPIAHSITAYALYHAISHYKANEAETREKTLRIVFYMFLAISADFDFIPQLLTGEKYHRGFSHSLIFSVCVGLTIGLVDSLLTNKSGKYCIVLAFVAYGSHLLLDFFTEGGDGIQLMWPISENYYISPFAIFPGVHHSQGLFHVSHFTFLGFELGFSVIILGGLWFWRKKCL